ncbi:MAG: hypothetical protein WCT77_06615 [Bacteroidota bacterium]
MLKYFKKTLPVLFCLIIAVAIIFKAVSDEPKAAPEPRKIPGITDVDSMAHGCVSCHKNYPEMKFDGRLSTILAEWKENGVPPELLAKAQSIAPDGITLKGKHPFKVSPEDNIPQVCNKCHGKSMKTAFPMPDLLHVIHLSGGKDNHFIMMFNGDCTHCHKMDFKTGKWSIVNGKESEEENK